MVFDVREIEPLTYTACFLKFVRFEIGATTVLCRLTLAQVCLRVLHKLCWFAAVHLLCQQTPVGFGCHPKRQWLFYGICKNSALSLPGSSIENMQSISWVKWCDRFRTQDLSGTLFKVVFPQHAVCRSIYSMHWLQRSVAQPNDLSCYQPTSEQWILYLLYSCSLSRKMKAKISIYPFSVFWCPIKHFRFEVSGAPFHGRIGSQTST